MIYNITFIKSTGRARINLIDYVKEESMKFWKNLKQCIKSWTGNNNGLVIKLCFITDLYVDITSFDSVYWHSKVLIDYTRMTHYSTWLSVETGLSIKSVRSRL